MKSHQRFRALCILIYLFAGGGSSVFSAFTLETNSWPLVVCSFLCCDIGCYLSPLGPHTKKRKLNVKLSVKHLSYPGHGINVQAQASASDTPSAFAEYGSFKAKHPYVFHLITNSSAEYSKNCSRQ